MNEQNIIALSGLIGILLYLVIGRTVINLLDGHRIEPDDWRFFKIFIFPLVIVWEVVVMMSNYLTDAIIGLLDHDNRMRAKKGRKLKD
jgi:hypothetical protein